MAWMVFCLANYINDDVCWREEEVYKKNVKVKKD